MDGHEESMGRIASSMASGMEEMATARESAGKTLGNAFITATCIPTTVWGIFKGLEEYRAWKVSLLIVWLSPMHAAFDTICNMLGKSMG
jgi:hypothetical protein